MTMTEWKVGDWCVYVLPAVMRGHPLRRYPATVIKVGPRRITIELDGMDQRVVKPSRLERA